MLKASQKAMRFHNFRQKLQYDCPQLFPSLALSRYFLGHLGLRSRREREQEGERLLAGAGGGLQGQS